MKQTLTQRVEALEKRLDNKCKGWHIFTMGASKCDRCGIENPSYTAMRGTGELVAKYKINGDTKLGKSAKIEYADRRSTGDYCVCKEPSICGFKRHDGNDICIQCGEYIKPQEDKMSQIIRILFFSKGWDGTKAEAYDIADRILAIVKGE